MIYLDHIGNLEDLLVLISLVCGNPKVVVDGRELTRNINHQKKPGVLQACRCSLCEKCYRREYFSPSTWIIGSQLTLSRRRPILYRKERQLFSDQMNRNCLDLILATCYCNYSTIENLRCLNSTANEII